MFESQVQPPSGEGATLKRSWTNHGHNPVNWPMQRKWLITTVTAIATFTAGLNATDILTAADDIGQAFGFTDDEFPNSYWTVTSWLMGAAIGPMLGMPLLEDFGVRKGYLLSYIGFTIFLIPQAVAQNFATLIVTRFFAGFFAGNLMNGMETVVADIFATDIERGLPLTLFILVYEAGFTLGPAYAACFAGHDWRWIFYTHLIANAVFLPILYFVLKETRGALVRASLVPGPVKSARDVEADSRADKDDSTLEEVVEPQPLLDRFYEAIVRPAVLLFTQPVIFVLTLWCAFATALVFVSTESIEGVYAETFGFSARQVGVVQVSIFIGEFIGFLASIPQNTYYARSSSWNKETPGAPVPEARLMLSIIASFVGLSGGLFWYAWASYPGLSWVLPSVGLAFVGFGIMIVVNAVVLYMTDAFVSVAGSGVAALALGENLLSAWLPLSTPRMYRVLGPHWASTLLAFVGLALSFVPIVLTIYGRNIRARSTLMEGRK